MVKPPMETLEFTVKKVYDESYTTKGNHYLPCEIKRGTVTELAVFWGPKREYDKESKNINAIKKKSESLKEFMVRCDKCIVAPQNAPPEQDLWIHENSSVEFI